MNWNVNILLHLLPVTYIVVLFTIHISDGRMA